MSENEHLTDEQLSELVSKYKHFTFAGLVQLYESECAMRDHLAKERARLQSVVDDIRARLRLETTEAKAAFEEHMR